MANLGFIKTLSQLQNPLRKFNTGFQAPLQSLKFLRQNKFLLVIGLAPHILGFISFTWFVVGYLNPLINDTIIAYFVNFSLNFRTKLYTPEILPWIRFLVSAISIIIEFLAYNFAGIFLVNIISSPIHDVIAWRSFQQIHGNLKLKLGLADFIKSLVSEASKLCILIMFYVFFVFLPILIPGGIFVSLFLTPIIFIVTVWFNGWDFADRTLALLNIKFSLRIKFALLHPLECIGLGIWTLIPFVGTFLGFCMAGAGGIAVANSRFYPHQGKHI